TAAPGPGRRRSAGGAGPGSETRGRAVKSKLQTRLTKLEKVAPAGGGFPAIVCTDRWDDAAPILDSGDGSPWAGRPLDELLAALATTGRDHGVLFLVGVNPRVVLGLEPGVQT